MILWPWKKKAPPLCVDCRWFVQKAGFPDAAGCSHPRARYIVLGDPFPAWNARDAVRSGRAHGICGPSGRLFEPKEDK